MKSSRSHTKHASDDDRSRSLINSYMRYEALKHTRKMMTLTDSPVLEELNCNININNCNPYRAMARHSGC